MTARVTPERVRWYTRHLSGESYASIARDAGLSADTVGRVCRDYRSIVEDERWIAYRDRREEILRLMQEEAPSE